MHNKARKTLAIPTLAAMLAMAPATAHDNTHPLVQDISTEYGVGQYIRDVSDVVRSSSLVDLVTDKLTRNAIHRVIEVAYDWDQKTKAISSGQNYLATLGLSELVEDLVCDHLPDTEQTPCADATGKAMTSASRYTPDEARKVFAEKVEGGKVAKYGELINMYLSLLGVMKSDLELPESVIGLMKDKRNVADQVFSTYAQTPEGREKLAAVPQLLSVAESSLDIAHNPEYVEAVAARNLHYDTIMSEGSAPKSAYDAFFEAQGKVDAMILARGADRSFTELFYRRGVASRETFKQAIGYAREVLRPHLTNTIRLPL